MEADLVNTVLAAQPDYANAAPYLLISGSGRIVDLEIELLLASTLTTPAWLFIFDSNSPARFGFGSPAPHPAPLIAPIPMDPGDRVSINPNTKWLPYKQGLILAMSSIDSEYEPQAFLSSGGVYVDGINTTADPIIAMNVSYHLVTGGC